MSKFICSCGILYGEHKQAFDRNCKIKGHTLYEIPDNIYSICFALQDQTMQLKYRIRKRNRNISFLKQRIVSLEAEVKLLKA